MVQNHMGEVGVLHRDALGDLQLQGARVQLSLLEHAGEGVRQTLMLKLARRKVDGYGQLGVPGFVPDAGLGARCSQDPIAQRNDQSRLFRQRDKFGGIHQAQIGMPPPDQRFHS